MFIYLSKKIAIPNNIQIRSLSWNKEQGYIACGGEDGLLKVLKLEMGKEGKIRGLAAPSNLSMNQSLEGHNGTVQVVTWNNSYQKLTSSDQHGLIIVWMLYKGSWYEEMINNRNKSVVKGMAWNADGQKICIAYEDGAIIVGSVDGNRLWGKEVKGTHLTHVEWSPDGKFLLFGVDRGEVHIYEQNGNYLSKVPIQCLQHVGMSTNLIGIEWYNGRCGNGDADSSTLVVAYDNGRMQMMKNENDESALVIDADMAATCVQWNYNGTIFAVTGKQHGTDNEKKNVVKFFNPHGKHIHTLRVPGREIIGCSWEGGGLRIALGVDSYVFFANIRPDYKWCYFSNTVAYAFTRAEKGESTVMFWNTNTNDKYNKYVKNLLGIASAGEYCVLSTKADDGSGLHAVILCNAIGTPVDSRYIDIEPIYLAMSESHVFATSNQAVYSWQYQTPKGRMLIETTTSKAKSGQERLFHIDDTTTSSVDSLKDTKRAQETTNDPICCITASEKILIVARESGLFQRYAMPHLVLTHRYNTGMHPSKIALNSNSSRASIVDMYGIMTLYDLETKSNGSGGQVVVGEQLNFERKDVWDVKWAVDNTEMFALMEKTRMYIFRNLDPEEPVMSSGYLCAFGDLQVKAVLLDDLMQDPENPNVEFVIDYEVKSLRDTRDLLEKVGIAEASQFIEDNSHPRLWRLLAEAALHKMDFETAETAFVHCKDYPGIQFTKKVASLQNENLRKAEVAAYFKQFDDAEKLYLDIDRRDLALGLRRLLGDWFRVVQLLKGSVSGVDDRQLEEAWNAIGDYYADRQKWENAITYYEHSHNQEKLSECYYMLEDYESLQNLMKGLPEHHKLLPDVAAMFASVGMCELAVEAYVKAEKVKAAIDCCITLNQWNTAIELAKQFNIQEIDTLLAKYAKHLVEKNQVLNAVELYRKANRFLDAAQMMYKFGEEQSLTSSPLLRLKKIYVLAALLVEEHKSHSRLIARTTGGKAGRAAASTITALLEDDSIPLSETRSVDQPWRGAEAYHFLLVTHRQLYGGYVDAATKTSLYLREFEDIINPEQIFSLLALASCANRAFGTCSKAFIKLESNENHPAEKLQSYQDLAMEIFTKYPPKDSRNNKAECTNCETMIPDWCTICPSCNSKFPVCVVTGRPITDSNQEWKCSRCKHSAWQQDIVARQNCPLCHAPTSNTVAT